MGAKVAILGGHRNDQLLISIRVDQYFYRHTHFHLGRDLANPLGSYLQVMGDGYSTTARINGSGNFDAATKYSVQTLEQRLVGQTLNCS